MKTVRGKSVETFMRSLLRKPVIRLCLFESNQYVVWHTVGTMAAGHIYTSSSSCIHSINDIRSRPRRE